MKEIIKAKLKKRLSIKNLRLLKKYLTHKYEIIFSMPKSICLPDFSRDQKKVDFSISRWEELRNYFRKQMAETSDGEKIKLLNAGCGDGSLEGEVLVPDNILLEEAIKGDAFFSKYDYYTLEYFDLNIDSILNNEIDEVYYSDTKSFRKVDASRFTRHPLETHKGHLKADLTDLTIKDKYNQFNEYFDVIMCIEVLEHVNNPFKVASNLDFFLKPGGTIIIVVPFSYPYHEDPEDYCRFTHKGVLNLFQQESNNEYKVQKWGYDCSLRRDNRKGYSVPIDSFGGWRENLMTYCELMKTVAPSSELLNLRV